MKDPKYQHGSSENGWMEQNDTPTSEDSSSVQTDTPRTDAATELYGDRPFMVSAVPVEFAEGLERELAASENEALCLRDDHDTLYRDYQKLEAEVERLAKEGELYRAANSDVKRIAEERNKAEAERDAYKKLALELCAELCQICKDPIHLKQLEELSK